MPVALGDSTVGRRRVGLLPRHRRTVARTAAVGLRRRRAIMAAEQQPVRWAGLPRRSGARTGRPHRHVLEAHPGTADRRIRHAARAVTGLHRDTTRSHARPGRPQHRGNGSGFSTIGLMRLAPGDCTDMASSAERGLDRPEIAPRGDLRLQVLATFPDTPVAVMATGRPTTRTPPRAAMTRTSPGDRTSISRLRSRPECAREVRRRGPRFLLREATQESAGRRPTLQLRDPPNEGRAELNRRSPVAAASPSNGDPATWPAPACIANERRPSSACRAGASRTGCRAEEPLPSLGTAGRRRPSAAGGPAIRDGAVSI